MTDAASSLDFVTASTVADVLSHDFAALRSVVEHAYALHGTGRTVNPLAVLLPVPRRPEARVMALPAYVDGQTPSAGVKWIASYPSNVACGRPRASAILVLNDVTTGRPFACLEGSHISAARTAASAVVAADLLGGGDREPRCLGFCGAGFIADYIHRFLLADGWRPQATAVFDLDRGRAQAFAQGITDRTTRPVWVCRDVTEVIRRSDVTVFATTATQPHVSLSALGPLPSLLLHISLRDLEPSAVASAQNVVDDVDHAFRNGTSLGLARDRFPGALLSVGSLYDVQRGHLPVDLARTRIFSPFGLGMLDVAVGKYVYDAAVRAGALQRIPDFFTVEGPTPDPSPSTFVAHGGDA
jgi:ornithine cyclodeaminase